MEHIPSVLSMARDLEQGHASWESASPSEISARITTGCVYEAQAPETFGLLVTRADPRTRRQQRPLTPIAAHWPRYAPSTQLLTGHDIACRTRRCRDAGRAEGHTTLHLGWPDFAAAYRAELDTWPFLIRLALARQVVTWLQTAPTITVLSFEQRVPAGSTADYWAQRHVFRDWLRSLLPLVIPLALPLGAEHRSA